MNRRMLLRGLLALPFVPLATRVAAAIELAQPSAELPFNGPWPFPSYSDIVATTLESRSKTIADNVSENNVLLMRLRQKHGWCDDLNCTRCPKGNIPGYEVLHVADRREARDTGSRSAGEAK